MSASRLGIGGCYYMRNIVLQNMVLAAWKARNKLWPSGLCLTPLTASHVDAGTCGGVEQPAVSEAGGLEGPEVCAHVF